jgi:hypothetical protein
MKTALLIMVAFIITQQLTTAEPLKYTFTGTITGFESDDPSITTYDFDVIVDETKVTYSFEVDFERDVRSILNPIGLWSYFYSDLLSEEIINDGSPEDNSSYTTSFRPSYGYADRGQLEGGSKVSVIAYSDQHIFWKIQDWYIGQNLDLIDEGAFSGGDVRFLADVTLVSIVEKSIPTDNPFASNSVPPEASVLMIEGKVIQDIDTDPHVLFIGYPDGMYELEQCTDLVSLNNSWKSIGYTTITNEPTTFRHPIDMSLTNVFLKVKRVN